jgi:hypothetical protein
MNPSVQDIRLTDSFFRLVSHSNQIDLTDHLLESADSIGRNKGRPSGGLCNYYFQAWSFLMSFGTVVSYFI